MTDMDTVVEFRVRITQGSEAVHDETYTLDLDSPNWDRFDLTRSEQQRCEELLSAVRDMWERSGKPALADDLPVPIETLLKAMTDVATGAIAREVENSLSSRLSPAAA